MYYAPISYLTVYISNFQCVDCQSFPYRYHTYLVEFTYRHNSQCVECQSLFAQCKKEGEHFVKVHIFWEGHKILPNLHQLFVLCTASQIIGEDFAKFCGLLRVYELWESVSIGIVHREFTCLPIRSEWFLILSRNIRDYNI